MSLDLISRLGLPVKFPAFFPPALEAYRQSRAAASETPDEYAAAYLLAAAATATGANVRACVQRGWYVRANIFVVIVAPKGRGKSILAETVFAPLVAHENDLRSFACELEPVLDEDGEEADTKSGGPPIKPCVIVNDVTGPAVLQLLETNDRQLLVNPDEVSALFARNDGGTARQLWCELYDGRRRRSHRASARHQSRTLESPYVSLIGTIQPALLEKVYNSCGDDGMLDRMLLVGITGLPLPKWPDDADDPALNDAWAIALNRLFEIESLAADAVDGGLEIAFRPEAVAVLRQFQDDLNALILGFGLPEDQYGVVNKIRGHAVRLALLHRCLRWAAGEFGHQGPLGDVDAADAKAARDAAAFFLGRWILWRPELQPPGTATTVDVGLAGEPASDPTLESLAATAAAAQDVIRLTERLVRYLRNQGSGAVPLAAIATASPLSGVTLVKLQAACDWLVSHGHAEWAGGQAAIRMAPVSAPRSLRRGARTRRPAHV